MRDAPTFAEPVQRSVVGDDPLGLAPTNERLYNSVFPGFNNYVRYIRVYAVLCWMAQQVAASLERGAAATQADARKLFEAAIEKAEVALVWANPNVPALAGTQRAYPGHDKPIEFRFQSFGTSQATLFDAPTYKPSLTNGLRFLEARAGDTYGCLPAGEDLANAFDRVVREASGYRWLKSPTKLTGRRSQVVSLAPALNVTKPSAAEQSVFIESFFPEVLLDEASNDDKARWLALRLTLRAVQAVSKARLADGGRGLASSQDVRACMARGMAPDGASVVDDDTQPVQAWWAVLQVRQLQKLCLETLYCVVERWIVERESDGGSQALDDCVRQLAEAGQEFLAEGASQTLEQMREVFKDARGGYSSLYEAAARTASDDSEERSEADVFWHIERVRNRAALAFTDNGQCEAVANAYIGLVFCACATAELAANPEAKAAMKADADSCSLMSLAELVERFRDSTVEHFLEYILKEWVVLRHFSIVTSRSAVGDGKNRFRFVMGDYGLERFDPSAPLPTAGVSADKLDHALMLCEQAGLLKEANGAYRPTSHGRKRLR